MALKGRKEVVLVQGTFQNVQPNERLVAPRRVCVRVLLG